MIINEKNDDNQKNLTTHVSQNLIKKPKIRKFHRCLIMDNWHFFHVRLNSVQVRLFSRQNSPYVKRYIAIPWEQATSPTSEDDDRSIKGEKRRPFTDTLS